jgi:hypothetical protein
MSTKKALLLLSCLVICGHAASAPVVGLWQSYPVVNPPIKVLARPNYVFTDRQLTEPAVFTGLQNHGGGLVVVCCVKVSKLVPLELKAVLRKYAVDTDFTDHMKGIKGLPYMYEAEPVDSKQWSSLMRTVMGNAANQDDASPFSVPVIGAVFANEETLPLPFQVDGRTARLAMQTTADGNLLNYQFTLGGKVTGFSQPAEPHD